MGSAARVWRVTAEDSVRDQRRVAGALTARGVEAGDRVVFTLGTSPQLLAAALGAARAGIVPVLLNATLLDAELEELIADAEPSLVIRDDAALDALLAGPARDIADVPLTRPMHYTSGTSGRPKGVWSGVLGEDAARALFDDEASVWSPSPSDTFMMASPLYHSVGVRLSTVWLLAGADVILFDHFDAATAAGAIEEHGITSAFLVPAHLQRLLALPRRPDVSAVRRLIHAGSPCPDDLKRAAIDAFPPGVVWEFYGSTEGQFTVCPPDDWLEHPGTVGRARPGRRLEVDDQGEVWCHAPDFARFDYWRDEAKTAKAWRGDAFTVGDLGRLDGDGYLYLDGRRSDLIISGGVNVYPAEVERVLRELDGVEDVAVFAIEDDRWGQRVCAAFVGVASPDDVLGHARARLAPYKRPKQVWAVDALPRTATGKIRRTAVAEQLGVVGR